MKCYVIFIMCILMGLSACSTRKIEVRSSIFNTKMEIQTKRYEVTVFEGYIKEKNTNEVIPFAEVKLRDKDGIVSGATTDSTGYFNIKNTPLGDCRLVINVDGYQDAEYEINIKENTYYTCAIKLKKIVPETTN